MDYDEIKERANELRFFTREHGKRVRTERQYNNTRTESLLSDIAEFLSIANEISALRLRLSVEDEIEKYIERQRQDLRRRG